MHGTMAADKMSRGNASGRECDKQCLPELMF